MDFESIFLMLRRSHILFGFVGLVAFWIPVIAKKGGRAHILAGRVFEWCGYYVAGSALFACGRYLLIPHHFAFIDRPNASPEELQRVMFAQFFLTILAFLAWVFLVQLRNGMRVVRTRTLPAEAYQNWEAKFWLYSQLVASMALIVYGTYRLVNGGAAYHWISIVVGAIPLTEFRKELRFYRNPRELKMSWWYKHMDCMCGCGVAFHTAGFVFTTRWMSNNWGLELPGIWQLVPWIVPAAIGVPLSSWWLAKYRRKFGDDGDNRLAVSQTSDAGAAA